MTRRPLNPHQLTGGLVYFARMLDKIRHHAAGTLHPDYHANLGRAYDERMCRFLGVGFDELQARTLAGGTDAEILAWCESRSRPLTDIDRLIWNGFATKRGWRDDASAGLERDKASSGLAGRTDIQTYFEYWIADEARPD